MTSHTDSPSIAELPERLRAIARHVLPGRAAADLGTDHGLLALALARSGRVPRVIATDLHAAALDRARARVTIWDMESRIDLRLGDGLSVLSPGDEIATLVVAGIGGARALKILDPARLTTLGIERLVVQVNRDRESLLGTLTTADWTVITSEEGPPGRWRWWVDVLAGPPPAPSAPPPPSGGGR